MVLVWSQCAGGFLAQSTCGVYMVYNCRDCEMDLFRWFGVFMLHLTVRSADRHRIDFGAFETLQSARRACEDHAQASEGMSMESILGRAGIIENNSP